MKTRAASGSLCVMSFAGRCVIVFAITARKLACVLLTRTMERRHQVGLDSYDRFFSNQDTMPKGGFGNLIALPLPFAPRKPGNSVFIDGGFNPYPDQWEFLSANGGRC
jgi:hypothetical protein